MGWGVLLGNGARLYGSFLSVFLGMGQNGRYKRKKIPAKRVAEEGVQIGEMVGSSFFPGVLSGRIVRFWV